MSFMFRDANVFDSDISAWDVSSVTSMDSMLKNAENFVCDITRWYTPSLASENARSMFSGAKYWEKIFVRQHGFRQSTGTSSDRNIVTSAILTDHSDGPASMWEYKYEPPPPPPPALHITDSNFIPLIDDCLALRPEDGICEGTQFGDMRYWDVSRVTNMARAFNGFSLFNADISRWNTSSVTNMERMFSGAKKFDQDITSWDVSGVGSMVAMFYGAATFNKDITGWETLSYVSTMSMFRNAETWLSGCIRGKGGSSTIGNRLAYGPPKMWECTFPPAPPPSPPSPPPQPSPPPLPSSPPPYIAPLTDRNFYRHVEACLSYDPVLGKCFASDYGEIASWDVSKVTFMGGLFMDRHNFNAEIQGWDVSAVTSMDRMFLNAYNFNRDIGKGWNVGNVRDMNQMFRHAVNFDQKLSNWDVRNLINAQMMFMHAEKFTNGMSGALKNTWDTTVSIKFKSHCLVGAKKWHETYQSLVGSGPTADKILVPWGPIWPPSGYVSGSKTEITNDVQFRLAAQDCMIKEPTLGACWESEYGPAPLWNTSLVTDMSNTFRNKEQSNWMISAWDTSRVTSMSEMFKSAKVFSFDISSWNISQVTDMTRMFDGAAKFNQNIGTWDTSKVKSMVGMLANTAYFDRELRNWDTSSVTSMEEMFRNAKNFNQFIDSWDTSSVTSMRLMFSGTSRFNQILGNWDTSRVSSNVWHV